MKIAALLFTLIPTVAAMTAINGPWSKFVISEDYRDDLTISQEGKTVTKPKCRILGLNDCPKRHGKLKRWQSSAFKKCHVCGEDKWRTGANKIRCCIESECNWNVCERCWYKRQHDKRIYMNNGISTVRTEYSEVTPESPLEATVRWTESRGTIYDLLAVGVVAEDFQNWNEWMNEPIDGTALPPVWKKFKDQKSGRFFYNNSETNKSVWAKNWERPAWLGNAKAWSYDSDGDSHGVGGTKTVTSHLDIQRGDEITVRVQMEEDITSITWTKAGTDSQNPDKILCQRKFKGKPPRLAFAVSIQMGCSVQIVPQKVAVPPPVVKKRSGFMTVLKGLLPKIRKAGPPVAIAGWCQEGCRPQSPTAPLSLSSAAPLSRHDHFAAMSYGR